MHSKAKVPLSTLNEPKHDTISDQPGLRRACTFSESNLIEAYLPPYMGAYVDKD